MNLKAPKIGNPFSSNVEEEKEALNQRLNLYKDKLEDQWTELRTDLAEHGKRAAIIGGVVLGVYGLMNLILPKADEEEEQEEQAVARRERPVKEQKAGLSLSGAVQSLLWTVAMSWAKEKVKDFVVADKSANTSSEG